LGKTVTLAEIAATAEDCGFVTCSTAFDPVSDNVQGLASAIAEAIGPMVGKASKAGQAFARRLESLSVEVNAGIVRLTKPVSTAPGITDTAARKALTDLIGRAATLATTADKVGLALFLDELQEASQPQLVAICNAIQDLRQPPVVFFGAGLPTTPERLMTAASFSERFDYQELTRLDRTSAERALLEPSLAHGVAWQQSAADLVVTEASGSPYMLQKLGDEAWLAASPEDGDTITLDHAQRALAQTRDDLGRGMFRGRWEKATPREQALLAAMACTANADGVASTSNITELLQTTTPALSRVRKSLIDKGMLESVGVGQLRFTMPGFPDYIREAADLPKLVPQAHSVSAATARSAIESPAGA
jgi:hypothetical protein